MEDKLQHSQELLMWLAPLIIFIIWDSIWKLIAMWKAARISHLTWFICIALISTGGILPIVYILMHRKNALTDTPSKS